MSNPTELISVEQARRPFFVGVDVGGTNIKIGVVDDEGSSLGKTSLPSEEERGPADAVARIKQSIDALLEDLRFSWDDVAAVGLGTPGTQDVRRGYILEPPNMPHWRNFPVRDYLGKLCGKPCSYANDANAAAFGEFWVGSGRNH